MEEAITEKVNSKISDLPVDLREQVAKDCAALEKRGIQTLPEIRESILNTRLSGRLRATSCFVVRLLQDKKSVPILTSVFKTSNGELMWESAKTLAALGGRRMASSFLVGLRKSEPLSRRLASTYALGVIGATKAVPELIRILGDRANPPALRGEAAEALGTIGDKRAVEPLISATLDKSVEVRFWSVFALGRIGDRRAVPRLKEVIRSEKAKLRDWGSIRTEARHALRSMAQPV